MILPQQISQSFASHRLVPEFVQQKYNEFAATTSFSVTLDTTPTEGNLLIILTGGVQHRTPSFPAGFTSVDMSGAGESIFAAYKSAGAGESATITVTWNLNIQGSLYVVEMRNIDTASTISLGSGGSATTFSSVTTVQYSTFNVPNSAFYLLACAFATNANGWAIDSGYTLVTANSVFYPARKIYSSNDDSEAPIWSGGSTESGSIAFIGFNGKRI